jgi:microcystin-dependent protein
MALESAQYISQLNVSNPLSTDTVSQADDHLRLIKNALKNTFPNLDAPVTATPAQLNAPVPVGLIAMWSGAIGAVPSGWLLCNGSNGTPDLRDRFIVGAGSTYAIGNTGGSATVTLNESQLPNHTHVISATSGAAGAHSHSINDPGHSHGMGRVIGNSGPLQFNPGAGVGDRNPTSTDSATTGISINGVNDHTHSISASAATTGGGQAHENRPPYFALAYIMKA